MDDTVRELEHLLTAAFDALTDGIVIIDAEGRVRLINQAASRFTGWNSLHTYGCEWHELLTLNNDPETTTERLPSSGTFEAHLHCRTASVGTQQRAADVTVTQLETPVEGYCFRFAVEPESARESDGPLVESALSFSRQGIWTWDCDSGEIRAYGEWRPDAKGYALPETLAGDELTGLTHPDDVGNMYEQLRAHLRNETPYLHIETRFKRNDGSWGDFLIRGQATDRDANGRAQRVVGTLTEISHAKKRDRHLQIALEGSRQGLWEWQPLSDDLRFSREWYALFGYEEGTIRSHLNDMQRILHPNAIAPGRAAIVPMLKGETDTFEVEHELQHKDGHYLTVLARGRAIERDEHGNCTRAIGTHVDITEVHRTRDELAQYKRFMEAMFEVLPQRVFWKDKNSVYMGCSGLFAADVGIDSPEEIFGLTDEDMPWNELSEEVRADDRVILEGIEEHNVAERYIKSAQGTPIWVETTKVAIRNDDDEIVGVLGSFLDITSRLVREQELQQVANAFTESENSRVLTAITQAALNTTGADYAFISRLDASGTHAEISAYFPPDAPLDGVTYDLDDTPCETTASDNICCVAHDVATAYPHDSMLTEWGIEAYAGHRLLARDGRPVGLMVLLFKQPISEEDRVQNALEVFAPRAGLELERELVHEHLRLSEDRLNAAIESGRQMVWEWFLDDDRVVITKPPFDLPLRQTSNDFLEIVHPEDREHQRSAILRFLRGESENYEFEGRLRDKNGNFHWSLVRAKAAERDAAGNIQKVTGTLTDISRLKRFQTDLEQSQQILQLVVDTVPQAIFWQDQNFRYRGANQQFADLAGLDSVQQLIGRSDVDLWWSNHADDFVEEDRALLAGELKSHRAQFEMQLQDSGTRWYDMIKVPMTDAHGNTIGILGAVHDISSQKEAERAAQRLAHFDPLTSLPNRRYFAERLEVALASASRRRNKGALLFIDLDQFKQVNDTLGHSVGDSLLQAVSERLQNVTRQEDTVARLGGDEFVVLLPDNGSDFETCARQAQLVADKIHTALGQPFQFDHHQFHCTPTIGISLFPEPGKGVEEVLKEADTAMYSGKAAGRNVTRFFQQEMEEAAQFRLRMEADLRQAIERREFQLNFQPQVDRTGAVSGAEVLLRWHHHERGTVSPADFIPIAEERGLIVEIGRWVLEASFSALQSWNEQQIELQELAINVSSHQFRSDTFVDEVEQLLIEYEIPPHQVVFEITESTVVEDVEATIAIMERLRRIGIRFAIDDFGIGYSSLSYLKRLPIDQLKIDRSFIADIGQDQNDEVICQTIIAMSQHLRLQTIAEGVETKEQFDFLSRLRCSGYQGYLFHPPAPEAAFVTFLQENRLSH